jgi:hypothetical protein
MTQTLYGTKGGSVASDLYTIDPVTAAQTSVGPTGHAITGLAFDPTTGILYGVTTNLDPGAPRSLVTINPLTGASTLVGDWSGDPLGPTPAADITFSPAGQLYGFFAKSGGGAVLGVLGTIDKTNGTALAVGSNPSNGINFFSFGDAIDNLLGVYYAFPEGGPGGGHIWTVNPATGLFGNTGTALTGGPFGSDPAVAACSFDQSGVLYAIFNNFPACHLVTIDLATGAVTDVGALANGFDGIAWTAISTPPPPPPRFRGCHISPQARFVITDLQSETVTWLDGLTLSAALSLNLNQPATIDISLRSNNRRVNTIFSDFDPYVAQSNRLIYCLMKEGSNADPQPWDHCRAAGILMSPQDQGDADVPTTHLVAYCPWQFLMGQPACDAAGALASINADGSPSLNFLAQEGGVIVATLLKNAILNTTALGMGVFIDAGPSYGGTFFWNGVIESTPVIGEFAVQQGMSVGQCWNELLIAGQDPSGGSGGLDIVLTPIYDPVNRPGYTHELSVYNLAGSVKPASPMAWGEFTRVATTADRQHDGTPGNFINRAYFYAGQGGAPVGLIQNAASVAKYNTYWLQQFFPQQIFADAVQGMAQQAITLGKQGKRTFTVAPDPMRAPIPFKDYNLGDRIPMLAPNSLRVKATGYQRIQSIAVEVNPDGATRVPALLTTPDWRGDSGT